MAEIPEDLAAFIKRRRKANRLTQDDLAMLAGVGRRFVSELENGKPSVQLDKVDAVLAVFGKRLGVVPATGPDAEPDGGPATTTIEGESL